jgi:hypothetical protein
MGSAVLVLALVAVLYLALRPPLDSGEESPAARLPPYAGQVAGGELPPVNTDEQLGGAPEPVPQPIAPVEQLGPNAILGRVVDAATGQPVTDFRVDVLPWEASPPLERLAAAHDRPERSKPFKSGAGIFRIERDPGRWDVIVSAAGYLPAVLGDVAVPGQSEQPAEVRMDHGPSLVGLVSGAQGFPAPDVPVFLHVTRQFTDAPPPEVTVARTDILGRFRFSPLPPGEYAVSLLELDNTIDRLAGLRVEAGTVDVSLALQPRHQVVIRVTDDAQRPIEGAQVELTGGASSASERTLASGQAVLPYLADGDYELSIERDGYEPLRDRLQLQGGFSESVRTFRLMRPPGP